MTNHRDLLVIRAKDTRGEILRYENGKITNQALTSEDVEKFKKIDTLLSLKVAELKARQLAQTRQQEDELEL